MKKSLLIAVAVMLCVITSVRAQSPLWEQTNGPSGRGIWAINFDSSGNVYIIADNLYRSSNDGGTWQVMPETPRAISTLPNGDLLGTFPLDSSVRISKDNGESWTFILQNISEGYAGGVTGTTAGDIFVSSNVMLRSSDEGGHWDTLPGVSGGYLRSFYSTTLFRFGTANCGRSTDRGESWTKMVNGLDGGINIMTGGMGGTLMAFGPEGGDGGNYWSTDDGRTWSPTLSGPTFDEQLMTFAKVEPVTAMSDQGMQLYDKNGKLIKSVTSGLFTIGPSEVSALEAAPNGEIWLAEGPTLFKINPASDSAFKFVSTPTGRIKYLVATAQGDIIAASGMPAADNPSPPDFLLFNSTDNGTTWNGVAGTDYISPFSIDSSGDLLAGNNGNGSFNSVIVSSNEGVEWDPLGSSLTYTHVTSIVVNPSGNIYMGCGEGVFRSTDKGATWDQLNSGITDFNIQSLAVSKTGEIFAGTPTAIFHSTDLALNWQALPFTPPDTSGIISLTINTAGDLLAAVRDTGIFWSHDGGQSWSPIGTGLSGKVNAMFSTPSGHVFAGTTTGVFYLPMGGGTWVDATPGLGTVSVLSITRDPSGTVYLGTDGEGVFRSTQTYNSIKGAGVNQAVASVTNLSLGQAYPNPMQNSGAVTIGIPEASPVRVELLNTLGERVKLITDRQFDAGSYSLSLDTHGLPNGVYYLMLTAGGSIEAEKVTIAR